MYSSFDKNWKLCIWSRTLNISIWLVLLFVYGTFCPQGFTKTWIKFCFFQCMYTIMLLCEIKGCVEKFYKIMLWFHELLNKSWSIDFLKFSFQLSIKICQSKSVFLHVNRSTWMCGLPFEQDFMKLMPNSFFFKSV